MSCVSRFFGILASNIFFVALLAMTVAVFTNRWAETEQTGVLVNAVLTDAEIKMGVFDMSARIMQGGKVVFGQASYSWCAKAGLNGPSTLWTDQIMYCNLLLTTQCCVVICLAFGLVAGVISAFLSANIIKEHKFKDIACAASFFMCVQFVSSVVAFASFFFIGAKINNDLDRQFPGIRVHPSYSVFLAVVCAGLVVLGLVTTSALGNCGRSLPAYASAQNDLEAASAKVNSNQHLSSSEFKQGAQ